jgi:hypothetical protein
VSITAAALGATVSSVKGFVELVERLINAPSIRRKARFEEFIRPIHEQLQAVHLDYSDVLRELQLSMPEDPESDDVKPEQVEAYKKRFEEARSKQESVRNMLRINADSIFEVLKEHGERRYLYCSLIYFLPDDHRPFESDTSLDSQISEVLQKGGRTVLNTPTSKVSLAIKNTNNPIIIRQAVAEAIDSLNMRLSDAARAYAKLQFEITQHSTK